MRHDPFIFGPWGHLPVFGFVWYWFHLSPNGVTETILKLSGKMLRNLKKMSASILQRVDLSDTFSILTKVMDWFELILCKEFIKRDRTASLNCLKRECGARGVAFVISTNRPKSGQQPLSNQSFYLGIGFYLFVSHGGMNDRGSTCKFRNERSAFRNWHVDPLSFISQWETNKYNSILIFIYYQNCPVIAMKYPFLNTQQGGIQKQPPEQPAHTSRQQLHGKMDVKFFHMFIVAENTGNVNIRSLMLICVTEGPCALCTWGFFLSYHWARARSFVLNWEITTDGVPDEDWDWDLPRVPIDITD